MENGTQFFARGAKYAQKCKKAIYNIEGEAMFKGQR